MYFIVLFVIKNRFFNRFRCVMLPAEILFFKNFDLKIKISAGISIIRW